MAFVTVAVHIGSLRDIASAYTATTTDNEGRFSFSGFKVGVGPSWVIVLYIVPLPFSHCRRSNGVAAYARACRGSAAAAPGNDFVAEETIDNIAELLVMRGIWGVLGE